MLDGMFRGIVMNIGNSTDFPEDPIKLPEWSLPPGTAIPTTRMQKNIPNAHWLVSYQDNQNLSDQGRQYLDALIEMGVV